jgi:hypothetical protein
MHLMHQRRQSTSHPPLPLIICRRHHHHHHRQHLRRNRVHRNHRLRLCSSMYPRSTPASRINGVLQQAILVALKATAVKDPHPSFEKAFTLQSRWKDQQVVVISTTASHPCHLGPAFDGLLRPLEHLLFPSHLDYKLLVAAIMQGSFRGVASNTHQSENHCYDLPHLYIAVAALSMTKVRQSCQ